MLEDDMEWYNVPKSNLQIMQNGSGELFVRRNQSVRKVGIRIGASYGGLVVTSGNGDGRLEPWQVNGLPAFNVLPQ